jgi:Ca2+-binding EF-hand superfamily protein
MFEKMDLNKDQMLSFDELKLGLHKFGHQMPDADVQILMEAVSSHSFPPQQKLNLHLFNLGLELFVFVYIKHL